MTDITSNELSSSNVVSNRYLTGNYAPVREEVTAFDLLVIGELPTELEGRYLRNGRAACGAEQTRQESGGGHRDDQTGA